MDTHYGNDEGEDFDEDVAFLPTKKSSTLASLKANSILRPLEILDTSNEQRSVHVEEDDEGSFACKLGSLLLVLASLCGVWWWSTWETQLNTKVQRWNQLQLKDIQHWCLDPKSTKCACANPLEPHDRFGHKTWGLAHGGNIREALEADNVDVVFLGDSIVEGWRGLEFGLPVHHKKDNLPVFEKLFHKDKGGKYQGLPLGIAGDKTSHLLFRIQNGEVPDSLEPSVWWIVIGTNDFLREDYCSPEVVLMGVKRIVEEVRLLRPGSKIVVNSLLPRSDGALRTSGKLVDPHYPNQRTVWQGIEQVNEGLKTYSEHYDNVMFFDATDIFIKKDNIALEENWNIPESLMGDRLHPTALGYQKWGESIVRAMDTIMNVRSSEQGRKPIPHS